MPTDLSVPKSRIGRLTVLGKMAGSIANRVIGEGARQLGQGKRSSLTEIVFTPGNVTRLTESLSQMRGAAMKVGQLLSMENGELLPPELVGILARLRDNAHTMPMIQVAQVLKDSWGDNWDKEFRHFSFKPVAAASIGQVHKAELKSGARLAVKVQYPGVRESINSDIDNVVTLLRLVNFVPRELDLKPLLTEAKRQLHAEANYLSEADYLRRFAAELKNDDRFAVPEVLDSHTTSEVLTMSYLDGEPIENLDKAPLSVRSEVATALLELALNELFRWGVVQTDPNFANYRYCSREKKLQLLDFGATREYPLQRLNDLFELIAASLDGDRWDVVRAATKVGYLAEADTACYQVGIVDLLRTAVEPAGAVDGYDFGASDLASRLSDAVLKLRMRDRFGRMPPPDVLFLHRKLGGLYLLFSRLRAKVWVRQSIVPMLEAAKPRLNLSVIGSQSQFWASSEQIAIQMTSEKLG